MVRPTLVLIFALACLPASADGPASANYQLEWSAADSGGGMLLSTSYTLHDSVAQPLPVGQSLSAGYTLEAGFHAPPDEDADGVRSFLDNCTQTTNPSQLDTNADGFGNHCDADLNNDGAVNLIDLVMFKAVFFTADADADLTGDAFVNLFDLVRFKDLFGQPPGPSGR